MLSQLPPTKSGSLGGKSGVPGPSSSDQSVSSDQFQDSTCEETRHLIHLMGHTTGLNSPHVQYGTGPMPLETEKVSRTSGSLVESRQRLAPRQYCMYASLQAYANLKKLAIWRSLTSAAAPRLGGPEATPTRLHEMVKTLSQPASGCDKRHVL